MQRLPGRETLELWLSERGLHLDSIQWSQLEAYLLEVSEYNEKVNITADSGPDLFLRHAADAFVTLSVLKQHLGSKSLNPTLLDLGAGAGFIGITLKIAWPELDVTLMESSRRKFQFLSNACAKLKIRGLHVILGRAPQALAGKIYDAVLVRAVASLEESARLALSLCRPNGGLFVSYQTLLPAPNNARLEQILLGANAHNLKVVPYRLPEEAVDRHLALFQRGGL